MSVLAMIHTCSEQTSSPPPPGRCFQTIFEAKGYPCRTWGGLSQAGVQFCWPRHMLLMAKGKGPGMPIFEPYPSSWLLRENCQWGVPGHKKWSSSWGLDYFTWKPKHSLQAFVSGIGPIALRSGDGSAPFTAWPPELWDSAAGHRCSLWLSLLPIPPAAHTPGLLELQPVHTIPRE